MTDTKKAAFPKETFENMLPMLAKLSDDQIDPSLREEIVQFTWNEHTALEVYEFMDRIAEAAFYGQASTFVMQVCNVREFYEKPTE